MLQHIKHSPPSFAADSLSLDIQQIFSEKKSPSFNLAELTNAYVKEQDKRNPVDAMYRGDNSLNHVWPDLISPQYIKESKETNLRYLNALNRIDRNALDSQETYTYDIFKDMLEQGLKSSEFPSELLPLDQFIGSPHNIYFQLATGKSAQPFNNYHDFENFLLRSKGFVRWMDQAIENMREGIKRGVVQPKPVVESMIPQMRAQILTRAEDSVLFTPVRESKVLSAEEKAKISKEYSQFINESLTPLFKKMTEFLEKEYLPAARNTDGLSALPNGKAWYEFQVRTHTNLQISADEIHELGLSEVRRIHSEMMNIARQTGFKGSLKEFFHYLESDPKFYFKSAEEVVQAFEDAKTRMAVNVPKLFNVMPKTDYIMQKYPASQSKSAPAASYIPAPDDGSRPAVFYINADNLKRQPKFGVETLSIHEAVPGHHFQLSLQSEVKNLPMIRTRTFYTGFAEGWALYAESIGKELGFFQDPYQYYGMLNAELFRSMRLVVDSGLHAKGWSREQAIAFMVENSTMNETDVASEVERYMIMPGQALAYKIGQLKIRELRAYSEETLGEKFDIKAFHSQVLLDGMLPLPLLEKKIKEWVRGQISQNNQAMLPKADYRNRPRKQQAVI